jgi:CYTH domain-containing protein
MANLEIERKFLINGFPELKPIRCAETEQGYLCHEPVVRIRRSSSGGVDKYKLCFKGKGTLVRTEMEMDLTAEQYAQLYDLLPEATVKKEFRTYALDNGLVLECSHVDPGEETSFFYAEVEFPSEEAAQNFVPPDFLGRDVTEDPSFTMSHYAKVKREKGHWPWASKK